MPFALAGAVLGAGALGAAGSLGAAGVSASAANRAADLAQGRYDTTRADLGPYNVAGQSSLSALGTGLGTTSGGFDLTSPLLASSLTTQGAAPVYNMPAFDATKYTQSPGYSWELSQGLGAVTSSAAGKTGALSGNMLKALDTYGTGLASQDYWTAYAAYAKDYQNQYNSLSTNYWDTANFNQKQQQNQYNNLYNVANLGEAAGAQVGTTGATLSGQAGTALQNAGTATASGITGATKATTGTITDLASLYKNNPYGSSATSGFIPSAYGTGPI